MSQTRSLTTLSLSQVDFASRLRGKSDLQIVGAGVFTSRLRATSTFDLAASATRPHEFGESLIDWIERKIPDGSALAGYRLKSVILPALAALPGGSVARVAKMTAGRRLVDMTCVDQNERLQFVEACIALSIASHWRDPHRAFDDWMLGRTVPVIEELQVNSVATWLLAVRVLGYASDRVSIPDDALERLQAWLSIAGLPFLNVHVRATRTSGEDELDL